MGRSCRALGCYGSDSKQAWSRKGEGLGIDHTAEAASQVFKAQQIRLYNMCSVQLPRSSELGTTNLAMFRQ